MANSKKIDTIGRSERARSESVRRDQVLGDVHEDGKLSTIDSVLHSTPFTVYVNTTGKEVTPIGTQMAGSRMENEVASSLLRVRGYT